LEDPGAAASAVDGQINSLPQKADEFRRDGHPAGDLDVPSSQDERHAITEARKCGLKPIIALNIENLSR
jgi:hypothetical protein